MSETQTTEETPAKKPRKSKPKAKKAAAPKKAKKASKPKAEKKAKGKKGAGGVERGPTNHARARDPNRPNTRATILKLLKKKSLTVGEMFETGEFADMLESGVEAACKKMWAEGLIVTDATREARGNRGGRPANVYAAA